MYDNLEYALERSRRNRSGLGRFVVKVVIPDDEGVEIAKTMKNRHYYTVYAEAERILELVDGESVDTLSP